MNYSCTICFELLQTNGDVPAVLQCGHIYHRNCINHWFSSTSPQNAQCPLCKKRVNKSKMIAPVYLSSNDETMASSSTVDSTEQNLILQQEIIRLKQINSSLEAQTSNEKQKYKVLEEKNKQLHADNIVLMKQKRIIKAVRKIADLDDKLGSDNVQTYLRSLRDLPNEDLLVHLGTWRAKFELSHESVMKVEKKIAKREQEVLHLTKKCERLKDLMKKPGQAGQSSSKPPQFNLRKSFENVIVLDTDSDDENEQDSQRPNLVNDELVDDEEEDFRVEEHNTSHVNHRSKRRIDLSDDEVSIIPRSKRVFQIDLSQDNDEDRVHAGPSSDYSA